MTPTTLSAPRILPAGDGITARAGVVAEVDGTGSTRVVECWGEPPLLPRRTSSGVHFVAGAAGPLGGDVLTTHVSVGPGARLRIGSVAPTAVRPGRGDAASRSDVTARIGPSARLRWLPQPTVLLAGSRHRSCSSIELGTGAELFWVEVVVLGNHDGPTGEVVSRRSVDVDGRALSRQELRLGTGDPTLAGPAVVGSARVVGSFLAVHPEWSNPASPGSDASPPGPGPGLGAPATPPDAPGTEPARQALCEPPARVGIMPLAGAAVELVGVGQSVRAVLRGWEALADRFADRAPVTSGAVKDYVAATR